MNEEAKKILDDSLKQDGFISQESIMPQYTSCVKAVQKSLSVHPVEENKLDIYLESRERILSSQANDLQSPIQHQLEARNRLAEVRAIKKWIKENL